MTIEEKARDVVSRPPFLDYIPVCREEVVRAIAAAIEEEREACLAVIATQKGEYRALASGYAEQSAEGNGNSVARMYAHSMTVCEILERRIRARSADTRKNTD